MSTVVNYTDFKIVESSNLVDPKRYDQIKGMEIARQKATSKLYDYCAFYLKIVTQN